MEKKKNNIKLNKEEISYFVQGYLKDEVKDYQASALLMAICINGLDFDETVYLTEAMINSGDVVNLEKIKGEKVDKHSTGGVGDTTTLVVGPLLASCGLAFTKLSGRGLGHTGGTLDKLESIEGFDIDLSEEEFIDNINRINIAIMGQTATITPADKKIYALRDVTATVDDKSLIASSIMSKKLAIGSDILVLDVKVGAGSFMKTLEEARELGKLMVELGYKFGRKTHAVLSNMDEPLGYAVGNSLEVIEAIKTLKGEGPQDLKELSIAICSKFLILSGICKNHEEAQQLLHQKIENKEALEKFKEMVAAQRGDVSYVDDLDKFKLSSIKIEVLSSKTGYIKEINALKIGEIAKELGAGRATKESKIDHGAGILLNKKTDDYVKEGELLATLYTEIEGAREKAEKDLQSAFVIGQKNSEKYELILGEAGREDVWTI
ncbi:Pyrimidine-nucleoside phosphorylase [Peptoniphilus sp. ING2-D1G]|nr:Pyrimidine-nucleoside phosphorylase [Peptoniphilus sp. ING2-D1G]